MHRDEDPERARTRSARIDQPWSPAGPILDLQRAVGNQAVAELFSPRAADPVATVQRDEADTTTGVGTLSIPDLKLDLPISSFQHQVQGPGRARGPGGEVVVTFDKKHLDPRLMKALTDGRVFETITVQVGGRTITMKKVVLSGLTMGGDVASMSLNFDSMEFPGEGGGGGSNEYEEGWGP
ncbi:MAG TPA: hypothetical protein VFO05_04230 [Candidatus Limnocylindrales bacterium]|nr:hypothetical protein [Candidatus Limnocylindrales bacterium]